MKPRIRSAGRDDLPFLREMLFHAVYWRAINRGREPSIPQGLAAEGVMNALNDWGRELGDCAILATDGDIPIGAAWYRLYKKDRAIRGYLDGKTPVLVLAVSPEYRYRGVGTALLARLSELAADQGFARLSLMVSMDNPALRLYRAAGFRPHLNTEDSILMVLDLPS